MYIQDPLYGGYRLKDEIIGNLMSTFEISRLASVKQANLTSLVFPGANHTRFEHTIGTVYLMDKVFKALIEKAPEGNRKKELEEEAPLMRLVAFLHDVCAFPFSHVIEFGFRQIGPEKREELKNRDDLYVFEDHIKGKPYFLNKIDHEKIRDDILDGTIFNLKGYYDKWYEDLHIDRIVIDVLEDSINKSNKEGKINFTLKDIIKVYTGKSKRYLTQLIDGDIDVDRVDHLTRDSYYSGIKHANFNPERLIESMTIEEDDLTISLHMGLPQAVHLMAARELLYDSYYNYSVTRSYETMFCRALYRLLVDVEKFDIDSILFLTDDVCLHKLLKLSYDNKEKQNSYSYHLFQKILHRDHLKPIFELIWPDIRSSSRYIPEDEVNEMLDILRYLDRVIGLEADIARKVGIKPENILIYRDHTSDDPRKEISYPDVPVNIWSGHKEGASKDIAHYHHWVNDIKEDWKDRWCVRIYTDKTDKSTRIMEAIFEEIPLIKKLYK
jgi:HD superfamily phosphohydrolase